MATAASGYPAYAGMDPYWGRPGRLGPRLPRLRGDGPTVEKVGPAYAQATPPTRGWTLRYSEFYAAGGGYPAYAGMDRVREADDETGDRLPRLRGDGPPTGALGLSLSLATPPTRGWTLYIPARLARLPAYRLPRLRGDGPPKESTSFARSPATPPTRGWTRVDVASGSVGVGYPAYAGMDPSRRG